MSGLRSCLLVRGTPKQTRDEARRLVREVSGDDVLWVGGDVESAVSPVEVKRLLGRSYEVVVLDLHAGLDLDVLGQCHGFIWGGGALVLRMPALGSSPTDPAEPLVVEPYRPTDVGDRFWRRFERVIAGADSVASATPLQSRERVVRGTDDQARVARLLASTFLEEGGALVSVTADRGRGKSSALGLGIALALGERRLDVIVTAPTIDAAAEVFRFASTSERADAALRFVPPAGLLRERVPPDVLVVDEAAQLPVPLLESLTRRFPHTRIAFSTTTRGYEGTGRGFVLRFLDWARREERPLTELTLHEPIRWSAGDPLERLIFDALALDATPAPAESFSVVDAATRAEHQLIDREALARDEPLLRDLFGLLVHAHYRTTPSDLHRALDAPNLSLHVLTLDGRVVAASLVAREGGLPSQLCQELLRGSRRLRGHALAENLITHCGQAPAGELHMVRSVRMAVHPAARRLGLATRLVDEIHRTLEPDLFGTVFGATPELLRFRQSVGYELVRVGVSRGNRTGEPAAIMLRAVSPRARSLLKTLREELARALPTQLALLAQEDGWLLSDELRAEFARDLPDVARLDARELRARVARYTETPQPSELAAYALADFASSADISLAVLEERERRLVEARVLGRASWDEATAAAGYPSVRTAMRGLRQAFRTLLAHTDGASYDGEDR